MMAAGERGAPPSQILPGIGDEIGGLMCAWGVTAALYSREKTGKGQVVDTSLMGSIIGMLAFILAAPAILGQEFSREIRAKAGNPLYNHYRCKDDKWIVIAHLQPDQYWKKICKAMGIDELQNDPKFTSIESRGKNAEELVAILDDRFATKTREEWMRILKDAECIFTPIQSLTEVVNDPQAFANHYIIDVTAPVLGQDQDVRVSLGLQRNAGRVEAGSPRAGTAHRGSPAGGRLHRRRYRKVQGRRRHTIGTSS